MLSKIQNRRLGLVLFLSVVNTLLQDILSKNYICNNLYIFSFYLVWMWILDAVVSNKYLRIFMVFYVLFFTAAFYISDPFSIFQYYIFVIGGLAYVSFFWYECYQKLISDQLTFFTKDNFILIASPVLFFLGMSILFGFKSHDLTTVIIIGNITLYQLIAYFVNFVLYSLILIYIYKVKKHA